MSTSDRHLAAIMFTDMVGYTALMQENEQLALERRRIHKTILEEGFSKYNGQLLQHYGDGTLSINTSAVKAILSAIEIQTHNILNKIDTRIGIHIGDILKDENGIYGDSVNIASRLESLAIPGSIFISEKLFDDVKNHESIHAKSLGFFELKNVKQPLQVFAISNTGLVVPSRNDVKGKAKETPNSIAVLPFVSLSSDPENEYFCDGITEELLNVLSGVGGLQVTSRTSAFSFKGTKEDIREIAAKLNVQRILEGSVRKAGSKVRITAQLINAADGYHIWSESYERNLEDIFEVQDDISRTIANKLRKNFSVSDHENSLVNVPTENMEAYKMYMQGIHYRGGQTMESDLKSLECFDEAIALAPDFINPNFYLVELYAFFADAGVVSIREAAEQCGKATSRAMDKDPENAWSQLTAGINALYFEWRLEKAKHCLEKAIALNPNLSMAYLFLSRCMLVMQQKDQIDELLRKAYHLDPMSGMTLGATGEISFLAGKFEQAIDYCNEALAIDPHNGYAIAFKAFAIGFTGDWDLSIEMLRMIYDPNPHFNFAIAFLGYAYARSGQTAEAEQFISKLEDKQELPESPSLHHFLAFLYLAIGDKEKFYINYEIGMQRRAMVAMIYFNSPLLSEVRNEKRLVDLAIEYGIPV